VDRPRGRGVGELSDGFHDPVPGRRSVIVASECKFGSSCSALLERLITVALEHQLRRTPNVDLGYHASKLDDRGAYSDDVGRGSGVAAAILYLTNPHATARL
jgi:hypothetical protein